MGAAVEGRRLYHYISYCIGRAAHAPDGPGVLVRSNAGCKPLREHCGLQKPIAGGSTAGAGGIGGALQSSIAGGVTWQICLQLCKSAAPGGARWELRRIAGHERGPLRGVAIWQSG